MGSNQNRLLTSLIALEPKTISSGQLNETIFDINQDLSATVAVIKIKVKMTAASTPTWKDTAIKSISITPNAMIAAVNLPGYACRQEMLSKYENSSIEDNGLVREEFFEWDFRDYMGIFNLGIPEEAQSMTIRIVMDQQANVVSPNQAIIVAPEVQIIQDETINTSDGYRTYSMQEVPIVPESQANKLIKYALPRNGFLDSIIIDNNMRYGDGKKATITEITIVRNEVEFPVKTTWDIERFSAKLRQANFPSNICYVNAVRPILADQQDCKMLEARLQAGAIDPEVKSIGLICEYVHFWKRQ